MSTCGQEIGDAELCNRPANHPGPCSAVSTAARRWARPESARARELRLEAARAMLDAPDGDELVSVLEVLADAPPMVVEELLSARGWRSSS